MANTINLLKEYSPYGAGNPRGKIIQFDDGTMEMDMGELDITRTNKDRFMTPTNSSRLDGIAYEYYVESVSDGGKYWWLLAVANDIDNPLDKSEFVGREIIIPDILEFKLRN